VTRADPIREHMRALERQGYVEEADELADTLELVAELESLGAISAECAAKVIRMVAEQQAELWHDRTQVLVANAQR
jgi:hypothetical protein